MTRTTDTTRAGSTYVRSAIDVPLRSSQHHELTPPSTSVATMSGNDVLVRGTYLLGDAECSMVKVMLDPEAVSRKVAINRLNAELSGSLDVHADTSGQSKG
jgi:hypothetical protein